MEIILEPEWEELVKKLIKHRGTAILLGATDSGKSTLSKYLIKELLSRNIRISFVDSDVGQSSLGLPGTISMKIFNKREDIDDFKPERILFIGSLNPAKKISMIIAGTKKMVDTSKVEGVDIILVDTTGLITGEVGKALKIGKIRAIKPKQIIALQRYDELEHILSLIKGIQIHRLKASRMAKHRSREARIKYREKRFMEYFRGSQIIKLSSKGLEFFYNGRPFDAEDVYIEPGSLVGINRNEDTIALGIFEGMTLDKVAIKTPLKSLTWINRIVFGDIIRC